MKRILLLADLHQQNYVLNNLEETLKKIKPETVILAGDLTNRNEESLFYAKRFEKIIKKNKVRLFFIHGNCDDEKVEAYFQKRGYSIHLRSKEFEGFKIIGIGGFGEEYPQGLDIKNSILITHLPPIMTNKTFRDAPLVHVFGHTHFWEYQKNQGGVVLVQLKAAMLNRAAVLELPNLKVNFISLENG